MKDWHLHVSGATAPEDLYQLVVESGFKTGIKSYPDFVKTINVQRSGSLDKYIEILHVLEKIQSSPYAMKLSMFSAARHCYLTGTDDLILRWNPYKRSQNFTIDLDKLIMAARSGMEEACSIFNFKCRMIMCMGRECATQQNEAIYKMAERYYKKGVIGIDVAGPNIKSANLKEFIHFYKSANKKGLVTTIHAGETHNDDTEEELRCVIEDCKAKRIGHGIQIVKYPRLMKIASKKDILFEVCISSNLSTGAVKSEHEFKKIFHIFKKYGIKYILCTDSTFPLNTDITNEYRKFKNIVRK